MIPVKEIIHVNFPMKRTVKRPILRKDFWVLDKQTNFEKRRCSLIDGFVNTADSRKA